MTIRRTSLPTNITPAKIRLLRFYWKFPMDMRIPPLTIKIMLEANPLKSGILVRRLAAGPADCNHCNCCLKLSQSLYQNS